MKLPKIVSVADWLNKPDQFDDVLDARSPAEYALDHAPGALCTPVLNDEERIEVGTLYKQVSPFEARKVGGAKVAHNIAGIVETHCMNRPKDWRPLVMCWRGGQRSGSLALVLAQVGWQVAQLEGGYKAFRHAVIDGLNTLPSQLKFKVLCGPTGVGKSRLLETLKERGAQVLDLENLACHRGSVLGPQPDEPQPSQKHFETRIWTELRSFNPAHEVFVEAESKKVGNLRVPEVLMAVMRQSPCVRIDMPTESRVQLLLEDYKHWQQNLPWLESRLRALQEVHGHAEIDRWVRMSHEGQWEELVNILLTAHYDPAYHKSTSHNFKHFTQAPVLTMEKADTAGLLQAAISLWPSTQMSS